MRNVTPCPNWRELLSAYQDQNLSPKDRKRVAAHLQTCDDCRKALAQMDRDRDRFIDAYMAPAAKADLRDSVLAALRADAETPAQLPARKFPWGWVFRIGNAVAVITLIVMAAVIMRRDPQTEAARKAWEAERQASISEERPDASDRLAAERNLAAGILSYAQDTDETKALPDDWVAAHGNTLGRRHSKSVIIGYADGHAQYFQGQTHGGEDAYDGMATIIAQGSKIPPEAAVPTDGSYRVTGVPSKPCDFGISLDLNGLKMAYDVNYRLQVKNALQKSRQAQGIIRKLGGFTMNYQYVNNEHEPAVAAFDGKVPAEKAEAALAEIEKLGNVRGLTIAGEDLTGQFQAQQEEIARQTEHAKKLDAIGSRSASKVAAGIEDQRHAAKGQVNAAEQALTGLTTRHELVTISATFYEAQPREPLTLARVTAGTRHVLNYALLLLVTVVVFFLVIAVVAAPFVGLRYWRRRRMAS